MLGLVNRPNDISLSRANQSQAKFKSAVGGNLLQSWVNLIIAPLAVSVVTLSGLVFMVVCDLFHMDCIFLRPGSCRNHTPGSPSRYTDRTSYCILQASQLIFKRWAYVIPMILSGWVIDGWSTKKKKKKIFEVKKKEKKKDKFYSSLYSFSIIYTSKWKKMDQSRDLWGAKGR